MRNKKGFTLIELLVVISIIALLLSIVMPSLNKVRQQARKIICSTNLHNLNNAMMVYQVNYSKFPTVWWSNASGYERELWWEPLIRAGILPKDNIKSTMQGKYEDLKIDFNQAKAYTCPEWPLYNRVNNLATDSQYGMGYAYNWSLSPILNQEGGIQYPNPEYIGKIVKGTRIVLIDSVSFFMDAYHFKPYDPKLKYRYENGYIATWHNNSKATGSNNKGVAVSGWSDGHVETMPTQNYKEEMLTGRRVYSK